MTARCDKKVLFLPLRMFCVVSMREIADILMTSCAISCLEWQSDRAVVEAVVCAHSLYIAVEVVRMTENCTGVLVVVDRECVAT